MAESAIVYKYSMMSDFVEPMGVKYIWQIRNPNFLECIIKSAKALRSYPTIKYFWSEYNVF